jgi:hypothetical protein
MRFAGNPPKRSTSCVESYIALLVSFVAILGYSSPVSAHIKCPIKTFWGSTEDICPIHVHGNTGDTLIDSEIRLQQNQDAIRRREQEERQRILREQMRQEQMRQEQMRQEQMRQEQMRQEQMRQEQMRQEQIRCSQPFFNEYYSFRIENRTENPVYYLINGRPFMVKPGFSEFHQLPKAIGINICNVQRYDLPALEFDSSFEPGMQSKRYRVGLNRTEYFSVNGNGLDLYH